MPPTGMHGLFGLFLASFIDGKHKYLKLGLVFGSVMPDLDLIGSVFIYILTSDKNLTLAFHRSITHSFITMSVIIIIVLILRLFRNQKYEVFSFFLFGLVVGMFLHSVADLFYLDGVSLFWPIQPFGDRLYLFDFTFEDLPKAFNSLAAKVIGTIDAGFESVYFLVFAHYALRHHVDENKSFKIRNNELIIHEWPNKLKKIAYLTLTIALVFLIFAFLSVPLDLVDRDTFIILLYIPFTPVYFLSGILPLLMKNTCFKIGTKSLRSD
ncbi:MAG: metal-dependent hydrolase [Candidatus Hodarchaeales archaeon]